MSKHTVVFIRHAKSETTGSGSDEKRALTGPGRDQAKKLGAELSEYIQEADTIFLSPAMRARQTWDEMAEGAGVDANAPRVRVDDVIYTGNAKQILEAVRLESSGYTSIVIGHEPTISAVVKLVVKDDGADKVAKGMATGSAAIVTWSRNWKEWHAHVATLADFIRVSHK